MKYTITITTKNSTALRVLLSSLDSQQRNVPCCNGIEFSYTQKADPVGSCCYCNRDLHQNGFCADRDCSGWDRQIGRDR